MTRNASLLIVDDSRFNRDALSRRLLQKGFLVETASDGTAALERVSKSRYDLILLDVEMPGMSGLEVLSRLRETYSRTELPVIMVTARTQSADVVEALGLGANDYVTKPVDFAVALARVNTHLSHKWAVEDLKESEERYSVAVRGANDGLWDWNITTNTVYWSPRWKALLGYEEHQIGNDPEEWMSRIHHEDIQRVKDTLRGHLESGTGHYQNEHRMLHADGTYRWMRCRGAAVTDDNGRVTRLAGSLTDITDSKVADALTGLPNRLLFVDLLDRAIKRSERRKDYVFALLVLGLDRFKVINESLGVAVADRLIVAVARRLQTSLRGTDVLTRSTSGLTLARLGGDEFTVLLDDITDASDALRAADRLRAALRAPFEIEGHQIFVSATVGITISTTGYDRAEAVLQDAAIALHRAKSDYTTTVELFDPAMRARAATRLQMETDLRNAVDNEELTVAYQPIISLDSGALVGFEALARWEHATQGSIGPTEFIPIAEDTGLIRQIGKFVLTEACRQMATWQRQFGNEAPGVMCVNVSAGQFGQHDLAGEVEAILLETGLDPSKLKLEITESTFVSEVSSAETVLARLRSIGVEWSIDDFGTGYSSLSYLHRLQADTVKIDRSFVARMGGAGAKGSEMIRAIIALALTLGMDVVAEGVETVEQALELQTLGCGNAQGFYFSRPIDRAAADDMVASQPWREVTARVS
ncbi:MAG TPA: EAL domain-containing protein [Vicinamibacterales bacterium]|nr:EAL domain-containing protein [Vicinamibacterales bacterium]